LDREGKAQDAVAHYRSYLEMVAQQPQDRPAPDLLVGIVLRMAACQAQASQPKAAIKSYQMAEKLAHQTGLAKLESVADVNRAQLEGVAGNVNGALQAYRSALALDDAADDKAAGAVDWFAYGQFLDQSGFPARMAYACLLKSESLGQPLSDRMNLASITEARQKFEKRLGREAAELRRNPDGALQEALRAQR
jgi:hypothetical protein